MKYLLLLLVVGVVLFLMFGRRRKPDEDRPDAGDRPAARRPGEAATMLACAHCGVHLPRDDAVLDAAGRAYCGEAHRIAGPR
ncbi:MAG TPA: PP0621 family protein [Archangium sp.]|jgi:uncharacterized protein|uniref:PP0621 family protein n=1 Tax=Archangium sp. TaxID=1872627 RepID=UPI0021792628|nr:PP0621 family protein [Archangium sp.]MBK9360328.1 hypothetical protein [Rubrivivax sp.]HEX5747063.1 PP0621 family protein [Archangium sp.]